MGLFRKTPPVVYRGYLPVFLDDPRVPEPSNILNSPEPFDPDVVLPSAAELAQEPDIAAALIAVRGLGELIS